MSDSMRWFRMHAEIVNDPKVMTMPEVMRWRFVALMCLKCDGRYPADPDEVSWALRITPDEVNEALALFKSRGFLTPGGDFRNWDKRQYKSDSSTERTRKWRQNGKGTSRERHGDALRAETESETETYTEKQKAQKRRLIEEARRLANGMRLT